MKLYPQLSSSIEVLRLAQELASLSIDKCRNRRATTHREAVYLATGGATKVGESHLLEIADGLTEIAERHGYPEERGRKTDADSDWAEFLHEHLGINPYHAAHEGMWHFITVVLVPDLVRWRWGASEREAQVSDRWITVRYRQRNTFGRLWWRSEILRVNDSPESYRLIHELGEDELVQIMERPSLSGNRRLSRITAQLLIKTAEANPTLQRSELLRDQQKRILRLGAFIEFQIPSDDDLGLLIGETFQQSVQAARSRSTEDIDGQKRQQATNR